MRNVAAKPNLLMTPMKVRLTFFSRSLRDYFIRKRKWFYNIQNTFSFACDHSPDIRLTFRIIHPCPRITQESNFFCLKALILVYTERLMCYGHLITDLLKSIIRNYHDRICKLEDNKIDLEQQVRRKEYEVAKTHSRKCCTSATLFFSICKRGLNRNRKRQQNISLSILS